MSPSVQPETMQDYYLKIQALTPAGDQNVSQAGQAAGSALQIPALSIVIFLTVLVIGAFTLLVTKSHQINKMLVLLAMAFIVSAVPIAMRSLAEPVSYRPLAGPQAVPKNVVINKVSSTGFNISWETDRPESGTIRLGPTSSLLTDARVFSEAEGQTSTSHLIEITGLKPFTSYYLVILSGSQWFNNQGQPIKVQTAPAKR